MRPARVEPASRRIHRPPPKKRLGATTQHRSKQQQARPHLWPPPGDRPAPTSTPAWLVAGATRQTKGPAIEHRQFPLTNEPEPPSAAVLWNQFTGGLSSMETSDHHGSNESSISAGQTRGKSTGGRCVARKPTGRTQHQKCNDKPINDRSLRQAPAIGDRHRVGIAHHGCR